MSDRHAIIRDTDFWSRLEHAASAWLATSTEKRSRRFWIDGFIPETATNTQRGADIEGISWVGEGSHQHEYRFIASMPQELLHHRGSFAIDDITVDDAQKQLSVRVSVASSPNQAMQRTAGRSDA